MANDFLEKNLEDIIFENKNNIHEKGFPKISGDMHRQFCIGMKRLDLVSIEQLGDTRNVCIYELKKGKIDYNAYFQLVGYFFDFCLEHKRNNLGDLNLHLYLIGSEVEDNVLYAALLSEFIHIYTYKYDYNGIIFEKVSCGWSEMKSKICK